LATDDPAVQQTGLAVPRNGDTGDGRPAHDDQKFLCLEVIEFNCPMVLQRTPETNYAHIVKGFRPTPPGS